MFVLMICVLCCCKNRKKGRFVVGRMFLSDILYTPNYLNTTQDPEGIIQPDVLFYTRPPSRERPPTAAMVAQALAPVAAKDRLTTPLMPLNPAYQPPKQVTVTTIEVLPGVLPAGNDLTLPPGYVSNREAKYSKARTASKSPPGSIHGCVVSSRGADPLIDCCPPALYTSTDFGREENGNPFYQNVRDITCSCTTTHCRESGFRTCNTTGLCFSEYLDRRDGSDPLVRGCIESRTPLLCENRRPAVPQHRGWPVLICCGENMCNARVVPTLPTPTPQTSTEYVTTSEDTSDVPSSTQPTSSFRDKVYLAMVLVGIFAVISIVVVAIFLARRQSTSYDPEFGRVSTNGYVKGCCDPPSVVAGKGLENKFALDT